MNPKVKAVVFDLGDVIMDWKTPLQIFLKRFGIELETALDRCRDLIIDAELGKIDPDELSQKLMGRLGLKEDWRKLRKIMPAEFLPRPKTMALLKELKGKYRLALLTNADTGSVEEMDQRWHFKDFFEVIADSSKLGMRKPDARIFKFVLKRLDLPAPVCLYIDDIAAYIAVARKLGFQTVHFTDPENSVTEIRKVLVLE